MIKEQQLRQELLELEGRIQLLDMRLADARHRIRHSSSPQLAEQAASDEKQHLSELDRVMTRLRAVEGQLLQIDKAGARNATLH